MPDLDQSIAEWRRQMLAAGIKSPVPLDELESHLRSEVGALVLAGKPQAEALELAVSRLGNPRSVQIEFKKIRSTPVWPVIIGSLLWTGSAGWFAMFCAGIGSAGLWISAVMIFTLTTGYGAAFLAGAFGMCHLCYQSAGKLSPDRQLSLSRAVIFFSRVAAGLVLAGLLSGMLWSRQHSGHFFGAAGQREPFEIGAWCAFGWLAGVVLMQWFGQTNDQAIVLMAIGGNIVVGLAWFGAGVLAGTAWAKLWPLTLFLGIHLGFLTLGLMSTATSRPKNV